MITKTDSRGVQNGKELVRLAFKSTDNKPTTGIMNGSTGIEVNTGKKYVFDEESGEWTEIASSGGGGGGGGSSDFSTAEVTLSAEGVGALQIACISDDELHQSVAFFIESFEAILYKGSQVCDTSEIEGTITVSGDAVYDSEEQTITITGDCTITIS